MPIDKKEGSNYSAEGSSVERDLEFQNIIGNLMISEFQVERLRSKLVEKLNGSRKNIAGYYFDNERKDRSKAESVSTFSHHGKLYRLSIRVDEMQIDK
jgi:hypothetical protein